MKVSLLLCVVILSAISASAQAQCTHEPVAKALRVSLITEDSTPIVFQNAFMNGLRSIPDVVVRTSLSPESDVTVYVSGIEIRDTVGKVIVYTWHYMAYRYWSCVGAVPMLLEYFGGSMSFAKPSNVEASMREDVATINVKFFEKLRQEREASHR
jgi:hypothetical protein